MISLPAKQVLVIDVGIFNCKQSLPAKQVLVIHVGILKVLHPDVPQIPINRLHKPKFVETAFIIRLMRTVIQTKFIGDVLTYYFRGFFFSKKSCKKVLENEILILVYDNTYCDLVVQKLQKYNIPIFLNIQKCAFQTYILIIVIILDDIIF
jgi:hypothetical protein